MSNIVKFNGAQLPTTNIAAFQKALAKRKEVANLPSGGGKQFLKLLKNGGYWVYGAKNTGVEEDSEWAINPMSLQTGFVAWHKSKLVGRRMSSIFADAIDPSTLEDVPSKWDEAVSFELVCVSGEDVGVLCEYTANSYGGRKAFNELLDALMKQSTLDAAHIVPIITMQAESYQHAEYGETWNPIFEVVKWGAMDSTQTVAPAQQQEQQQEADTGEGEGDDEQQDDNAEADPPAQPEPPPARRGRGRPPAASEPPKAAAPQAPPARRGRAPAAAEPPAAPPSNEVRRPRRRGATG